MPLTPRQTALLAQMRADNVRAGPPFVPTAFWSHETSQFDVLFDATGINSVENEYFNTRFSGVQPNDPRLYRWFLWTYYNVVKRRDRLGLLDRIQATLPAEPGPVALTDTGEPIPASRLELLNGKPMSPDLLFSVDDFYNLCELDPRVADVDVVVADLGAGWGRLGYILLCANPRARYVVMDIPETLLIASERLPGVLGQVNAYLELIGQPVLGGSLYLRNAWLGAQSNYDSLEMPSDWERVYLRDSRATCDFYEGGFRVC